MDFPSIALLTDFGERDGFVGVMKGVIYKLLAQPVPIIDISHQIAPQNIRQASWILENAYPYFPPKTIFIGIVDPRVGAESQASLLCWWPERQQAFIAPDNGLLTPILDTAGSHLQVYDIRQSAFWQETAHNRSRTFHGRDVYAPMAALSANALLENAIEAFLAGFGTPLPSPVRLQHSAPQRTAEGGQIQITGHIVYTDIFGNLITNIPNAWIKPGQEWSVHIEGQAAFRAPCFQTYSNGDPNQVILVPSSGGTAELSINQGNVREFLQAQEGQSILLQAVQ